MNIPDDIVIVRGSARTVAHGVCQNGSVPSREFIESLEMKERAKLLALFLLLANFGKITNKQKFRHERDEIWGFKPTSQIRIAAFHIDEYWILTHGFKKKSQKWPMAELDRADRIRSEHLQYFSTKAGE